MRRASFWPRHCHDSPLPSVVLPKNFDVIERCAFAAIGRAFDADFIAWTESNAVHHAPRGCRRVQAACRKVVIGCPGIYQLASYEKAEPRSDAGRIEVANLDSVPTGGA